MRRHIASEAEGQKGFSLIEVLCALAIAAMAMVALLRGMGNSQTAAGAIEARFGARLILQSLLNDELSAASTVVGRREGASGRYRWSLDIAPAAGHGGLPGLRLPQGVELYRLRADVSWGRNARLTGNVLELGRP